MARSPLRDRRILIVDQDAKDRDDRTWCFWTDQPTLFDAIVSCSWSQFQVQGKHLAKTLDLQAYRYKMIRGIDFYRFATASLVEHPHIDFLQGRVERIEDGVQEASIVVEGQKYAGTWVFDSLFDWSAFRPDPARYHSLAQQFKGWAGTAGAVWRTRNGSPSRPERGPAALLDGTGANGGAEWSAGHTPRG